jgi:tRNA pseudouridine38-40 synthase
MGWQRQDHGPSVQAAIERAAKEILQEDVVVHAAGRTDAGVHALGMRAHLDVTRAITPFRLMEALNARLRPDPVAILDCEIVPEDWHARFTCLARHYEYRIITRRAPLTWEKGLAWRVPQEIDADAMHDAAQILVGLHDFTTFRSAHCQSDSPVKTLDRLDVIHDGARISVLASARSFLHHQVRSMVGCLELVGQGKWSKGDLKAALDAADRTALGFNAPPDGLYFLRADYPPTD